MSRIFTSLSLTMISLITLNVRAQAFTPFTLTQTFNNPTPESFGQFGDSVSIDGTKALVGAPGDNTGGSFSGAAYLFNTTNGNLLQTFKKPNPQSFDRFGESVSIDATNVLIGADQEDTGASAAGSAYLFNTTTGNLLQTFNNPTPELNEFCGESVSVDGTHALSVSQYRLMAQMR